MLCHFWPANHWYLWPWHLHLHTCGSLPQVITPRKGSFPAGNVGSTGKQAIQGDAEPCPGTPGTRQDGGEGSKGEQSSQPYIGECCCINTRPAPPNKEQKKKKWNKVPDKVQDRKLPGKLPKAVLRLVGNLSGVLSHFDLQSTKQVFVQNVISQVLLVGSGIYPNLLVPPQPSISS